MNAQVCSLCENPAVVHVDDVRNRHVSCPHCGNYIAADAFAAAYADLDPDRRATFVSWMARSKEINRYLVKTRPLKNNSYGKQEGFRLISIAQIKTHDFASDSGLPGRQRKRELDNADK